MPLKSPEPRPLRTPPVDPMDGPFIERANKRFIYRRYNGNIWRFRMLGEDKDTWHPINGIYIPAEILHEVAEEMRRQDAEHQA